MTDKTLDLKAELEAAANKAGKEKPAPRERTAGQDRSGALRARETDDTSYWERANMQNWAPSSQLELPPNDAQYVYRWISEYVNGSMMTTRLTKAKREGWQFVQIDDLPEGFIVDEDTKGDGLARVGGLIMARLPRRFAEQRKAHYARRSAEALDGANQLQGVAGKNAVKEDRGTRSLDGPAAGNALRTMAQQSA
jgi:hypothetical protein